MSHSSAFVMAAHIRRQAEEIERLRAEVEALREAYEASEALASLVADHKTTLVPVGKEDMVHAAYARLRKAQASLAASSGGEG